jgi:hypothetical protein
MRLTEEVIAKLFGHEAAEDELPSRLKEYYFRSSIFDQMDADLPLRLLVGHKGIGKSALFQIAMAEDREKGRFAVELRPDDVAGISTSGHDFLTQIAAWKRGMRDALFHAVARTLRPTEDLPLPSVAAQGIPLINWLSQVMRPVIEKYVDAGPLREAALSQMVQQRQMTVYIDDLDRGWMGKRADIERLSALLSAARDLIRENPGLRFRISLRSDVFFLVRTSDESTDKIQGSVIWYSWTNHEILALLVKRVETYFGRTVDERHLLSLRQHQLAQFLEPVIVSRFEGTGKWANAPIYRVIMSLIRRRPRDLVKLMTLAAREAAEDGEDRIHTVHLQRIFSQYSQDRVQDTVNEYRSELPNVERLILGMKPSQKERKDGKGFWYSTGDLLTKIKTIEQGGQFRDATGRTMTSKELCAFLYKINFLIASKVMETGFIDRKYFEENRYLSSELVDFGYDWEVHPAYRWALQPDRIEDIFARLALSDD